MTAPRHPHGFRTIARLIGLCACVNACAVRPMLASTQRIAPPEDSAIVVAVLRAVAADSTLGVGPNTPLVADPRPLRRDGTVVTVDSGTFAPVSSVDIEARRTLLRELGVTAGDATFPRNCAGTMVPRDPVRHHAGCPAIERFVAALGLPRVGDALDDLKPAPQYRTVRVILAGIGPDGISAEIRDYVLRGSGSQWTVVKVKLLGYWE